MGDFFRSIRFKILLGVLVLLLFFMLRAAWTGGVAPLTSQATGLIVTPLQRVSSAITHLVGGYFERYINADQIMEENKALKKELAQLREQMVDYARYRQENESLREFLDLKEQNPDFELQPGTVVARDPNDRFHSFTIDVGALDGVSPYDPVVSADGLVGRVKEVSANWAKVTTILDPALDVGVKDNRTRDIGTVTGSVPLAQEGKCRMDYLPRESGAAKGDLVVTTGAAGLFPAGMIVGTISDVRIEGGGLSLYAVVEPTTDIRNVKDVMVIKSFRGQEAVTNE